MVRLRRLVLHGIPYHVTQRGNRREQAFFDDGDYALYPDLHADAAGRAGIEIWSYCLMTTCTHRGAGRRGRAAALLPLRPSPLHRLHQCAHAGDRSPVAGAFQLGGDG